MPESDISSMMRFKAFLESHHPGIRLLGVGYESCVFTDDSKVYKVFRRDPEYYAHIGKQIKGRFRGCRHLYDVECESFDECTVFVYDYEHSKGYSGGMESEIIEMMSEFALCGVACTDIKPNNFRVTSSGLKYIDYGHNLVPFNESDFVAMCLRSFLCLKYWAEPQFIPLAQITNFTWPRDVTEGFTEFFNKIYSQFLERRESTKPSRFRVPHNRWMNRMIDEYSSEGTVVHCLSDMSDELFFHDISSVDDIDASSDLFLVMDAVDISAGLMEKIISALDNGKAVRMIMRDPFFNSGFTVFKDRLVTYGIYPIVLSHSDPVPSDGGYESRYALLELNNSSVSDERPIINPRNEDYIFIVRGCNVPLECYLRCWHSLENLRCGRWGAVIVDDASDDADLDHLIRTTACRHKRVTYVRNEKRGKILPNMINAIRNVCTNPNSVIITLDMDDALLNKDALCMIRAEYLKGHDLVSSTCLKKDVRILPYEIDYGDVRGRRVGDVWMHIRSFRKYLFDLIPESEFKDGGEWIDIFNELTFMVPIAEMSSDPIQIKAPLYLWEPRTVDNDVHKVADAHTKALIRSREPYARYHLPRRIGEIRPPGMLVKDFMRGDILIIRHAEKEKRPDYLSTELGITERGERESEMFGSCLERIDLYACSEIRRTSETAYCMNKGNGGPFNIVVDSDLNGLRYDYSIWLELKAEYGYPGVLTRWRNGEISEGLPDFREFSVSVLRKLLDLSEGRTVCIVTHDHMVRVISTIFMECIGDRVPYMGGFVLKRKDVIDALDGLTIGHAGTISHRTADPC